jgi:hypothetical protein
MLERRIAAAAEPPGLLPARLASYPAVALVGPRQCGKTTLPRSLGGRYYDLEQGTDRLRLDLEWADVAASDSLVILDEVQESPEVFALLRGAIDADRRRSGRFLLLGSVAPALMMRASESLVGRLSVLEQTPPVAAATRRPAQPGSTGGVGCRTAGNARKCLPGLGEWP